MIVLHYWKNIEGQEHLTLSAELVCNVYDFLFITSGLLAYQNAENFHNKPESSLSKEQQETSG